MSLKKAKVEAGLTKKGFEQIEGDHHFFVYVTSMGTRTTVRTKTSHTPEMKEIPDNLLGQMAKQCKLSKRDFVDLINCPLSQEDYEVKLRNQGIFKD
jgi:predicted RNA binding protein YcfA (HicA-like mRNA interferase family)